MVDLPDHIIAVVTMAAKVTAIAIVASQSTSQAMARHLISDALLIAYVRGPRNELGPELVKPQLLPVSAAEPMRESRPYGSVRGAPRNERPYREPS